MASNLVLVVDDDELICRQLTKELERNYYNVLIANNRRQALKKLSENDVNIVLLDVKLPDVNGLHLLEEMKSLKKNCEIIIVTGYGTRDIAIRSLRNGAIDYLEKPIDTDNLNIALGRAMERLLKMRIIN